MNHESPQTRSGHDIPVRSDGSLSLLANPWSEILLTTFDIFKSCNRSMDPCLRGDDRLAGGITECFQIITWWHSIVRECTPSKPVGLVVLAAEESWRVDALTALHGYPDLLHRYRQWTHLPGALAHDLFVVG